MRRLLERLRFPAELEREFIQDYNINSLFFIRLAIVLIILLYSLFGVLDIWMLPRTRNIAWLIRFGALVPLLLATLALTYNRRFQKYIQTVSLVMGAVAGAGIIAMLAFSMDSEPGYTTYYAGLMLVIAGVFTILRLRFYYAIISSLIIVAGYEFVAVFVQDMTAGGFSNPRFPVFINSNFFLISQTVIGLFACFTLEYYIRQVFFQRKKISEDSKRIAGLLRTVREELQIAQRMQRSIIPARPPVLDGAVFTAVYRPMEELGGDYYDFIDLGGGRTGIIISDVSGHGVPAALVTSMLKTLVSSSVEVRLLPDRFLSYLNRRMREQMSSGFITAFYAVLNEATRELRYARAGHPSPLLLRGGEIIRLDTRGGCIAAFTDMEFEMKSIRLQAGDRIIFYTDGLTEAKNGEGKLFEEMLFGEVIPSLGSVTGDYVQAIFDALVAFRGSESFSDDVCIIGLEVR
jgi:hypothetical protein